MQSLLKEIEAQVCSIYTFSTIGLYHVS